MPKKRKSTKSPSSTPSKVSSSSSSSSSFITTTLLIIALGFFLGYWCKDNTSTNIGFVEQTGISATSINTNPRGWCNWRKNICCSPKLTAQPSTESEIIDIVKKASNEKQRIKIVGSGHSFSPIQCADNSYLLNLDHFNKIVSVNKESKVVTVQAGIRLRDLNRELREVHNLALPVMSAIDEQSYAGAMSTGTHGSSLKYGALSAHDIVKSIDVVLANATVVHLTANGPTKDLFHAAQLSLGAIGVIIRVDIQCVSAFNIEQHHYQPISMDKYFATMKQDMERSDYPTAFWIPYENTIKTIYANATSATPPAPGPLAGYYGKFMHNLFYGLVKLEGYFPTLSPYIHKFLNYIQTEKVVIGTNNQIFRLELPNQYSTDSEYFVDLDDTEKALQDVSAALYKDGRFNLNAFYIFRVFKGDTAYLSGCQEGRLCTSFSFYLLFQGQEINWEFLSLIEKVLAPYNVRPHLGKMHTMTKEQLKAVHPLWDRFVEVRRKVDPAGMFLNDYTTTLFA